MRALLTTITLLLGLAPACAERPAPPAPPAAAPASGPAAHAAAALPPFSLALDGRQDRAGVTLTAELHVHWAVPAPLEIALALPPGAALTAGSPRESVASPATGDTVIRRFRVEGAGDQPIRLTASQSLPDRVGATATRTWPAPAPPAAPAWERVSPVQHGALRVEQAIRLEPGQRP
ncbi:MAG: hypothetical protein CVU56_22145 [Deltaproteobacteria bacterium HGW-Deltaproteobacteria-14]|jgi:hypothetical protein|nr:MAG: hypothetical protein CVU56_22145 [Deltaproteobacteria bacterium HGW-Deltaproteobacteria-14]